MKIRKFRTYSHCLGQEMPIAVYGHFGMPLLAFPTAAENFEEYERQGMVKALEPHINRGAIKLYTIDSINNQSWSNAQVSVPEAARRHQAYDDYVSQEVSQLIFQDCGGPLDVAVMGASFGAYHAVNTLLKHPRIFRYGFGLSGVYDISEYFANEFDHNCYSNSPVHYLPNLRGTPHWEALQTTKLTLICGQGPWERVHWTTGFGDFLKAQGMPHTLDLWGHDVAHDWPWWFKQMNLYLSKGF